MAKKPSDSEQGSNRAEPQRFDKIFRQNIPVIFPAFMEKVFRLRIASYTELKDKIQTTKQLEVDGLWKVTDANGETYIIHLEIQTSNDKKMPIRLLEYLAMLHRIYGLPVRQYVLYIGEEAMTMPDSFEAPGLHFSYMLINFSTLPHEWFLSSPHIEEQLLAILGDLGGKEPNKIVEEVVSSIDRQPADPGTKIKYFKQLRILAQLRTFTQTKKAKEIMLRAGSFFRKEKDVFYMAGAEDKSYGFVKNLIIKLGLSDEQAADLAEVSIDFVRKVRADLAGKKK